MACNVLLCLSYHLQNSPEGKEEEGGREKGRRGEEERGTEGEREGGREGGRESGRVRGRERKGKREIVVEGIYVCLCMKKS